MRRQKYFFDFKFGISVKFRVEWCISLYDSLRICLRFLMQSFLRRREDIQNIGKIGNLNMNHMVIYIIRRGILRWFRIWSQKIFLPTHSGENRVWKNLREQVNNGPKFELGPFISWTDLDDGLWLFFIDGRNWTADEHGPSTLWTDQDDGPLKFWNRGRRWTSGQMDESPSVEAWAIQ